MGEKNPPPSSKRPVAEKVEAPGAPSPDWKPGSAPHLPSNVAPLQAGNGIEEALWQPTVLHPSWFLIHSCIF